MTIGLAYRAIAFVSIAVFAAIPAAAAPLALKRVVLSSGGVGYFEYETPVEGDATAHLLAQVARHLGGERGGEARSAHRVHQYARALQVMRAVAA